MYKSQACGVENGRQKDLLGAFNAGGDEKTEIFGGRK